MNVFPLLIALAGLSLVLTPARAQTQPAKPPAKAPAKTAAPAAAAKTAEGKTLSIGGTGGSAGGPILSRDELRACLRDEEAIRKRLEAHDGLRAPLDQEKAAIALEQGSLREQRGPIDEAKKRAEAFGPKVAALSARVQAWNDAVAQHNSDNRGTGAAYERRQAELTKEREAIEAQRLALEAERTAIASANEQLVRAYNAKVSALDGRVSAWNERNAKWNDAVAVLDAERKTWVSSCADRRYREDDETAIKAGK
jgi:chromosome segregation ATPase